MAASRFVGDLTWDAVRDVLERGAAAILPIGAGAKQHGFHIPLSTDARQAERFAVEAASRTGALIWPTLTYGWHPAFTAYAGSVSVERATFEAIVKDVLNALLAQTTSFVLVIDTGISTIEPVEAAIARSCAANRVHHLAVYRGAHFMTARGQIMQQISGGHADEIETSIMLALAPELVDMDRAEASPPRSGDAPGPLSTDATASNYAPSGSTGDPTLATADKGRRLLAAIMQDLDLACARAAAK